MAEWQQNELAGVEDIAYIVGSHADVNRGSVEGNEILQWPEQHGFYADALVLDNGRNIIDMYIDANPGPTYTEAVTVVIDKQMRIRKVGGTYEEADESNLELMLQLLNE